MQLQNLLFGHFEYSTYNDHFTPIIEAKLRKMEMNGYVVLRTTVPDSHHVIRVMGNVGDSTTKDVSTAMSIPRQLHKSLANKEIADDKTPGVDADLLVDLFYPTNMIHHIRFGAYILFGELCCWGGYRLMQLDSLGNCSTPKELSEYLRRTHDEYNRTDIVSPAYVSLVITELRTITNRFLATLPKKAIPRRAHLAAFLREFTTWHRSLNSVWVTQYAVKSVIGEELKRVWSDPAVKSLRTDFITDVYFDSRMSIEWRYLQNLHINYLTTLVRRIEGVWDPVAQCQGI